MTDMKAIFKNVFTFSEQRMVITKFTVIVGLLGWTYSGINMDSVGYL